MDCIDEFTARTMNLNFISDPSGHSLGHEKKCQDEDKCKDDESNLFTLWEKLDELNKRV